LRFDFLELGLFFRGQVAALFFPRRFLRVIGAQRFDGVAEYLFVLDYLRIFLIGLLPTDFHLLFGLTRFGDALEKVVAFILQPCLGQL